MENQEKEALKEDELLQSIDDEILQSIRGYHQATYEYFRHLSSLSTLAIIIIAAFMEKVFVNPVGKTNIAIAIFCFLLTIISSVIAYTIHLSLYPIIERKKFELGDKLGYGMGLFFSWAGFLFGMIFVTVFLIQNILN
ncbi:hypothetical protein [Gimesia algae]|uniref:DUF202 domain-containing protein n=1 Tax=Gimesia algae TaxID=2527971 RepID=A0A517VMA1_9PLAN|nr:hypothetical protein [Gimesia algae]QDT94149.1 hypothetical protein Pan161_58420 [Gimesia algae]